MDRETLGKAARQDQEKRAKVRTRLGIVAQGEKVPNVTPRWADVIERNRSAHKRASKLTRAGHDSGANQTVVVLPEEVAPNVAAHVYFWSAGEGRSTARISFLSIKDSESVVAMRGQRLEDESFIGGFRHESTYAAADSQPWAEDKKSPATDELGYESARFLSTKFNPLRGIEQAVKLRKISGRIEAFESSLEIIELAAADSSLNPELAQSLSAAGQPALRAA